MLESISSLFNKIAEVVSRQPATENLPSSTDTGFRPKPQRHKPFAPKKPELKPALKPTGPVKPAPQEPAQEQQGKKPNPDLIKNIVNQQSKFREEKFKLDKKILKEQEDAAQKAQDAADAAQKKLEETQKKKTTTKVLGDDANDKKIDEYRRKEIQLERKLNQLENSKQRCNIVAVLRKTAQSISEV